MVATGCNESDHSTVEILGTLAIIGVLSVMGVVGYKMATTKFRANELLDGAIKHAAMVAIQISTGINTSSIDGFENNSVAGGASFSPVSYNGSSDTFDLVVTNVADEVASQLQNQVVNASIIRGISRP